MLKSHDAKLILRLYLANYPLISTRKWTIIIIEKMHNNFIAANRFSITGWLLLF